MKYNVKIDKLIEFWDCIASCEVQGRRVSIKAMEKPTLENGEYIFTDANFSPYSVSDWGSEIIRAKPDETFVITLHDYAEKISILTERQKRIYAFDKDYKKYTRKAEYQEKQKQLEANGYKFSSAKSPNSGTVIECPNGEIIQSVVNEWYSGDSCWSAASIGNENWESAINQAWEQYKKNED